MTRLKTLFIEPKWMYVMSLLIFMSLGCNNSGSETDCDKLVSMAESSIKEYYESNNPIILERALEKINACTSTPRGAYAKVEILNLLKECEKGLKFSTSLKDSEVSYSYKKSLFINLFSACLDSMNRKKYLENTVSEIEIFLSNEPKNQEAWVDLFSLKDEYLSKDKILEQLDSLVEVLDDPELVKLLKYLYGDGV